MARLLSGFGAALKRVLSERDGRLGMVFSVVIVLFALIGPAVGPAPNKIDVKARFEPPGVTHLLGTDNFGRDLFARTSVGTRYALALALSIVVISSILGSLIGIVAGVAGGWVDRSVTAVFDIVNAFPPLILAFARNVAFFHLRTKRGEYALQAGPPMRRLRGKTLGLFGLGRIGRSLAAKAAGVGLRVVAHTASGDDHGTGLPMLSLTQLLQESDFLSLHAPLTDVTRHVLNRETLARMKPTAVVINTSRGPLIDPDALQEALAVLEGAVTPEAAWDAVSLDERWQIEKWGADDEAVRALDLRQRDFLVAARFLSLF